MSAALKVKSRLSSSSIEELRSQIDFLDTDLLKLIEKRADLVFAVSDFKRTKGLPIYDQDRELAIKKRVQNLTDPNGSLTPTESSSIFMDLVERFRLLESAHSNRDKAQSMFNNCSIDFSLSYKVAIWGFGLLGSSFFLALKEILPHWEFLAVDPAIDPTAFQLWKTENSLNNIRLCELDEIKTAKLVVLGAPVDTNNDHLLNAAFAQDALVMDLGSTKQSTQEVYLKRQNEGRAHFTFVGGHPLAGKETSGYHNGDSLLFYNKVFCWAQPTTQPLSEQQKATFDALALCLGARPIWVTSAAHDHALAWTSHLPQLLSSILGELILNKKFSSETDLFPGVVSELLRVSGSSFSKWSSIISTNKKEIHSAVGELIETLSRSQQHLNESKGQAIESVFQKANEFYDYFMKAKRKRSI